MVAAGGTLVEYVGSTMHPRRADLARGVISGCVPFNTLRLRKRLAQMLKVDQTLAESASAPQVHHSTINAVLRPIAPAAKPTGDARGRRIKYGSSGLCPNGLRRSYRTCPAPGTSYGLGLWYGLPVKWAALAWGRRSPQCQRGYRKYGTGLWKSYGPLSRPPLY